MRYQISAGTHMLASTDTSVFHWFLNNPSQNPTDNHAHFMQWPAVWRCESRRGWDSLKLFFHSSHNYFCQSSCEQVSATPWMASRRDRLEGALLSPFVRFTVPRLQRPIKDTVVGGRSGEAVGCSQEEVVTAGHWEPLENFRHIKVTWRAQNSRTLEFLLCWPWN